MGNERKMTKMERGVNFIDEGYAFQFDGKTVRVMNLNNMSKIAVIDAKGNVKRTNMNNAEIAVIKKCLEDVDSD